MIKRKDERVSKIRKNMRVAPGEVTINHYFKKDEMNVPYRSYYNGINY
ncbi:MAG: hypothetical protein P9M13_05310 [Candidatus Ancaeobacter aquaticus]|nr:hypothetical protein [Candidatus Ancaeobacter aquaticus]